MSVRLVPQPRKRWLTSFVCSSSLHALAALIILGGEVYWLTSFSAREAFSVRAAHRSVQLYGESIEPTPAVATFELTGDDVAKWFQQEAAALDELVESVDDPQWAAAVLSADVRVAGDQQSTFITGQVLAAIAAAERESPEANFERLEALGDRLTSVSSAESIDQLSTTFSHWLGTSERAAQPVGTSTAGEFDFASAQLHDVLRTEEQGTPRYTAVLLDSAGRTTEAQLTTEEGESVYCVMQLMKRNPLLERVYRGIVLALLDKLMTQAAGRATDPGS